MRESAKKRFVSNISLTYCLLSVEEGLCAASNTALNFVHLSPINCYQLLASLFMWTFVSAQNYLYSARFIEVLMVFDSTPSCTLAVFILELFTRSWTTELLHQLHSQDKGENTAPVGCGLLHYWPSLVYGPFNVSFSQMKEVVTFRRNYHIDIITIIRILRNVIHVWRKSSYFLRTIVNNFKLKPRLNENKEVCLKRCLFLKLHRQQRGLNNNSSE